MAEKQFNTDYDRTNPVSIFEYSGLLIGHSLRSLLGDKVAQLKRKGKGGLGQMVEELFFRYEVNSNPDSDFSEAGLELKCTPLLKKTAESGYRIKERLVCTMIDYFDLAATEFEDSHLLSKCRLMLLLFYLHVSGMDICDYKFLFRVLWELPEKDLLQIRHDYETLAAKVRRGEAHMISEGDTMYLGACRKGQKGDKPQPQPYSDEKALKRAFSLKPAYMRYVLEHVVESGKDNFTNYSGFNKAELELVDGSELSSDTFENILKRRFAPFIGLDYIEICDKLNLEPYQSKSKYAEICALIASNGKSKRINNSEEFIKSGLTMKTIRLKSNGMPAESMSFRNIDYCEVFENDEWTDSDTYDFFTSRFMFVVLKEKEGEKISLPIKRTGEKATEQAYVLDRVFFWTMPPHDLETAEEFWKDIRRNVVADNIKVDSFWSIRDKRKFHVRPKAATSADKAVNPHGGECPKLCYWFNADYVKSIIESQTNE